MKSFADWTQELAESVGEVKHHWEDPKVEEAIEPRWQGKVPPMPPVPVAECEGCRKVTTGVSTAISDYTGNRYQLCDACCRSNGFRRP